MKNGNILSFEIKRQDSLCRKAFDSYSLVLSAHLHEHVGKKSQTVIESVSKFKRLCSLMAQVDQPLSRSEYITIPYTVIKNPVNSVNFNVDFFYFKHFPAN